MASDAPVSLVNAYKGTSRGALYEQWREEICRGFFQVEIDPGKDGMIDMHGEIANLQPTAIAIASGTSAVIGRTAGSIVDGVGDFAFVCNPQSRMRFMHRDEALEIDRTQVCLSDMAEPARAVLDGCGQFTTLRIGRQVVLDICPDAEDLLFKPIHLDPGLNDMIGRYASLAVTSAPRLDGPGRFLVGQHLVDLVGLALGAAAEKADEARQRGHAQASLSLMKADILSNLRHPGLNLETVARRYKISPRQVQRQFRQSGITFTQFLLEQRLLLARKLLIHPANHWRKISDIAHSAGFTDLPHFTRVFRRRFGATPLDMRGAGRKDWAG